MTKFMVVCDSYKQCLSLCIPSHPQLIPVSPRPTLPPRSRVCSVGDGPRDHDERAELDERHRHDAAQRGRAPLAPSTFLLVPRPSSVCGEEGDAREHVHDAARAHRAGEADDDVQPRRRARVESGEGHENCLRRDPPRRAEKIQEPGASTSRVVRGSRGRTRRVLTNRRRGCDFSVSFVHSHIVFPVAFFERRPRLLHLLWSRR